MDAVTYVQSRGVGVYVDGQQLRAYPASRLDGALRSFIRDHREDLIRVLQTPSLDVTVGNILALSPEEVEELRAEIAVAPDDARWIEHDRQALRIADATLARRAEASEKERGRHDHRRRS